MRDKAGPLCLDAQGHPVYLTDGARYYADIRNNPPAWVSPTGERVPVRWRGFAPDKRDAAFERAARQIAKARPELRFGWELGCARGTSFLRYRGWHRGGAGATVMDALPYDVERDSAV